MVAHDDPALLELFRAVAARERDAVARALEASPRFATTAIGTGASRQDAEDYFLTPIQHYVYGGDTALHIAAAAYDFATAQLLVAAGAQIGARNRRGAEPLHYAAEGHPDGPHWNPDAQAAVIAFLIAQGADPNALDNSGVAPLHRAVRTRCAAAVRALIDNGSDPLLPNKSGSTPLHLAVQNTGRSNSGSDAAKEQQREIIATLLQHGARPTDTDAKGTTVTAAASSAWIRELLV